MFIVVLDIGIIMILTRIIMILDIGIQIGIIKTSSCQSDDDHVRILTAISASSSSPSKLCH